MPHSTREQRAWYWYDWANSAFPTTVVTVFLGPYLTALAENAAGGGRYVRPLGIPIDVRSWWPYLLTVSVLLQVVVLPVAGAVADASPRKKSLLGLFACAGAAATFCLFFTGADSYLAGGLLFVFANVAFGASVVVYNSFLPDIAAVAERDAVSSRGWGFGYIGGGLLLALNLLLFFRAPALGLTEADAVRISLASAGIWWAAFTFVPLAGLKNRTPAAPPHAGVLSAGFRQLGRTLAGLRNYPRTLTFLLAYLLYNDAIQAVITLAGQFGAAELKMPLGQITLAILMVQFAAFFGAIGFDRLARGTGAKAAVMISLVLWTCILAGVFAVRGAGGFFVLAGAVAIVLGGSQALSRSLFSLMIPRGREAEYFSLYEISDKGTSWMAPLLYGLALQFTGSFRVALVSLILFFLAGLAVLSRVDVRRAAVEAGNPPPAI